MPTLYIDDLASILPFLIAVTGGVCVVLLDIFSDPKSKRAYLGWFSLITLVAMAGASLQMMGFKPTAAFFGAVADDNFAAFLNILIAVSAGLAVLIAMGRLPEEEMMRGEFYALLLFSSAGASLFVQAKEMVTMFIALETLSIPAYILAASHRGDGRSTEAGFKYFILGAFSSGFLVYGIALLYGATGSTAYNAVLLACAKGWMNEPLLIAGVLLVLVGMLFKIGAAPFHMWAPDVYQGSPTPATAFFATGVKAAAFAALARLLFKAVPSMVEAPGDIVGLGWYPLMQGIAILTMTAANLAALVQTDVKRILAYSSIAHAGYIFLGFLADSDGVSAMLFYLVAYTFMTAGAFALVAYFERLRGGTSLAEYGGLGRRYPAAGAALSLFLFSLAGIPPTAGFFAKFYLFKSAVDVGLITLVVIAVVNSAVSAFYYLRIMVSMYMESPAADRTSPKPSVAVSAVIVLCILVVLGLGLYPTPVLEAAAKSAASLF